MKKTLMAAAVSLGVICGAQAHEAGTSYVGTALEFATWDEDYLPDFDSKILSFKAGYFFVDHFGLEAKLGLGVDQSSENFQLSGANVKAEIKPKSYVSLLAVGVLPVHDKIDLYAKGGFTYAKAELKGEVEYLGYKQKFSETDSGSSASGYLGASFKAMPDLTIDAEFGALYVKSDVTVSSVNVGLTKRF